MLEDADFENIYHETIMEHSHILQILQASPPPSPESPMPPVLRIGLGTVREHISKSPVKLEAPVAQLGPGDTDKSLPSTPEDRSPEVFRERVNAVGERIIECIEGIGFRLSPDNVSDWETIDDGESSPQSILPHVELEIKSMALLDADIGTDYMTLPRFVLEGDHRLNPDAKQALPLGQAKRSLRFNVGDGNGGSFVKKGDLLEILRTQKQKSTVRKNNGHVGIVRTKYLKVPYSPTRPQRVKRTSSVRSHLLKKWRSFKKDRTPSPVRKKASRKEVNGTVKQSVSRKFRSLLKPGSKPAPKPKKARDDALSLKQNVIKRVSHFLLGFGLSLEPRHRDGPFIESWHGVTLYDGT